MTTSSLHLFLVIVVVGFLSSSINTQEGHLLGDWTPIKNLSDPHVMEIAEFVVSEHNKQSKATLQLQKVVSGKTQVVSGINYRLVLLAKDGAIAIKEVGKYEAIVWEKASKHSKSLTLFKPI